MKKIFTVLCAAMIGWCTANAKVKAGSDNLLLNAGFEEYSCNPVFGCSFEDWSGQGTGASASTDRIEGEVALLMNPVTASVLDQAIMLTDADYAVGSTFEITIHYKVLSLPEGTSLMLDCQWEAAAGGNTELVQAHDAGVLQVPLAAESDWKELTVSTSKPAKSSYLRVRVKVPKNGKVLFDDFRVVKTENTEPFIEVSPATVPAVAVNKGESAAFKTIHLHQGNLSGATTFYIGGADRDHFSLSATSLPADQSDLDIVVTYAPKAAGTHTASLVFDNPQHTTILPDMISLQGSCVDPEAVPTITVTPATIPAFETVVGKQVSAKFTVKSENCTEPVYLSVSHQEGAAFTIVSSMLPKNYESEETVYFTPLAEGSYRSTITISSAGATPVTVVLNGVAQAKSEETIDWKTSFLWDESKPLALLNEDFESASHNQTLLLSGWQNVAAVDERPWWGFDESRTTPPRGDNKCAKATAYQYGQDSTGLWEAWLVTPALDYKNAEGKIFAFSVMGEYMPEDGNKATLELVYIDATNPKNVFYQTFDGISIPKTADENNLWVPFQINLENQPNMDIFHMAFRYTSPNGGMGSVAYYIDDVSWGRTDLPEIVDPRDQGVDEVEVPSDKVPGTKVLRDGHLYLIYEGRMYDVTGARLR